MSSCNNFKQHKETLINNKLIKFNNSVGVIFVNWVVGEYKNVEKLGGNQNL